jgi:hypothetical protein
MTTRLFSLKIIRQTIPAPGHLEAQQEATAPGHLEEHWEVVQSLPLSFLRIYGRIMGYRGLLFREAVQ